MTKKKASLRGKGSAILLGEETAEESPPTPGPEDEVPTLEEGEEVDWSGMLEDEAAAAEPEVEPHPPPEEGEGFPPEADVDWSAMLEDEISVAEPPEGEEATPSVPDIEYYYPEEEPAVPESEFPPIEEPAVTEPTPVSVSPAAPVTPAPAEPQPAAAAQPPASPAAAEPPVSAAADQPSSVVPTAPPRIRVGGLLAGVSLTDAEAPPPGPGFEEVQVRALDRPPPRELSAEEEELVIRRVSQSKRRELFDHVSKLYREVPKKLSSSGQEGMRREALLLLSEARDIVLEDPRQFDEAEYKVAQVEAIIAHAEDVEKWSHYYGNRLIAYLVTWFVVLMAGIVFIGPLSAWLEDLTSRIGTTSTAPSVIVGSILFTMFWGGVGGVVGGLYSLWRHIAVFDKQYTTWYTLQPISGLVLGGIVHVIIMAGFLSMTVQAGGTSAITSQEGQAVQWFPALLAVVFGFRQNNFYALLDRIIELIGQPQEDEGQSDGSA